jgi:hypothetical protein
MGQSITSASAVSQCPQCGAKVLRPELSLCAYCASPLGLAKRPDAAARSATTERLAKMRTHPDFAQVLEWTPEDPRQARVRQLHARSAGAGVAGVALLAWAIAPWLAVEGAGPARILPLPTLAGLLLAGYSTVALRSARKLSATLPHGELLRRPALVTERRSETRASADTANCSDYFFTLEFEDGAVGEFLFPGRGTSHDLLVPGNTGLAFTRGAQLLDFIKVRV